MANYFIGIDGGGTKSKLVLVDENLNILSEQIGIGTNLLSVGIENAAKTFFEIINKALRSTNNKLSQINGIAIGTAGAGRHEQVKLLNIKLLKILANNNYKNNNLFITSDAEITLKGAFPNGEGIILIAGTGSILYGKDEDGKVFRIGGMGKLIGDEGSGYSIGRQGLALVAKMFDGRKKKSQLIEDFKNKFQIETQAQMIDLVYNENFKIARFAEFVIDAAAKGDAFAQNVLDNESEELLKHIKSAITLLNSDKLNLTLSGSLLVTENYYSKILKNKILNIFGNVFLCSSKYPPEIGAALLSIEGYENQRKHS